MDSHKPSSTVVMFFDLIKRDAHKMKGIEMCCGKGRNVVWLAEQGIDMTGFDFSRTAIREAKRRAEGSGVESRAHLSVEDATRRWKFESGSFDFVVDCFASTDIESYEGRALARDEAIRVLKPNGLLMVYALSTKDEFHKDLIKVSPLPEKNTFLHPQNGKFSKTYDRKELIGFYPGLRLVKSKCIRKTEIFYGKEYKCSHLWMVFRKRGKA